MILISRSNVVVIELTYFYVIHISWSEWALNLSGGASQAPMYLSLSIRLTYCACMIELGGEESKAKRRKKRALTVLYSE